MSARRFDENEPRECAHCGADVDALNPLVTLCALCVAHEEDLATIPSSPVPYPCGRARERAQIAEHTRRTLGR